MADSASSDRIFRRGTPVLFVFLWSTGWIVARYSAEYADPLTFLSARCACAGEARSLGFVDTSVSMRMAMRASPAAGCSLESTIFCIDNAAGFHFGL